MGQTLTVIQAGATGVAASVTISPSAAQAFSTAGQTTFPAHRQSGRGMDGHQYRFLANRFFFERFGFDDALCLLDYKHQCCRANSSNQHR